MQNDRPHLLSFEDVARDYLETRALNVESEMAWFASASLTLTATIERACTSVINGALHSHQQRPFGIWPQAPKGAATALKSLESKIAAAHDFAELHTIICTALAPVTGFGPVAYYDTARRIGERLRPKLMPMEVFLHAGTREGARALNLPTNRDRLSVRELPEVFQLLLTPAQAEDALCIYRVPLGRIARNGLENPKTVPRSASWCGPRSTYPMRARPQGPGRC